MILNGFAFNSSNGDRKYTAESLTDYFALFIGNGVFLNNSNAMRVQISPENTGLSLMVNSGACFINGKAGLSNSAISLDLNTAHASYDRRDRIVARLNMVDRVMEVIVKEGTAQQTPAAPDLIRNEQYYELSLAEVVIPARATAITQSSIIDTRMDSRVCGYVTGLVEQLDTTELSEQWTAEMTEAVTAFEESLALFLSESDTEFNTWFTGIKTTLESIDVVQLMNRQDAVEASLEKFMAYDFYASGSADNAALNSLINKFYTGLAPFDNLGNEAQALIRVHGLFDGTGAVSTEYSLDIAPAGVITKRLTVDFTSCSGFTTASLDVSQATIKGLRCELTGGKAAVIDNAILEDCMITNTGTAEVLSCYNAEIDNCIIMGSSSSQGCTGIKGSGIKLYKSTVEVSAAGTAIAVQAADVLSVDSDLVAVSSSTGGLGSAMGAFGLYADNSSYYRIIGGSVRAYATQASLQTSTSPSEAAAVYVAAEQASALVCLIGVNLPHPVRTGYADHSSLTDAGKARYNSIKANSGRYLILSCSMFKDPLYHRMAPDWDTLTTLLQTACTSTDTNVASANAATFVNTIKGLQQSSNMSWGSQIINKVGTLI